jgi:hypothetical protein
LIHSRGLAAAVCLNIAITVTTTMKRAAQTSEERKTMRRALPRRPKHERAWRAYPRCRMAEELSTMSQPVPAHPCSHPPAETKPVAEVVVRSHSASVVDAAMPMRRAVCTATLNTARMMLSSRRHASAVRGPLAATLREGLRDRLDARGASAALPTRHRPSKDTSRWTKSPKTSVVVGGGSALLLWEATPSEARVRMSFSRHQGSAAR